MNRLVDSGCEVILVDNLPLTKQTLPSQTCPSIFANSLAKAVLNLAGANLDIVYEKSRVGDVKASFADISRPRSN